MLREERNKSQSPATSGRDANSKNALIKHIRGKLSPASKGIEDFEAQAAEAINGTAKSPSNKVGFIHAIS